MKEVDTIGKYRFILDMNSTSLKKKKTAIQEKVYKCGYWSFRPIFSPRELKVQRRMF